MTTTGFWGLQTPISIWTCLEVKSRFMMEANVQVRRTNSRYDIMDPSPYWYSSSIQSTLLHKCTWKLKYIGNIPKSNTFEGARGVQKGCTAKAGGCSTGAKEVHPPKPGGAAPVSGGAPSSCTKKYCTNQGAPLNIASPKHQPPNCTSAEGCNGGTI